MRPIVAWLRRVWTVAVRGAAEGVARWRRGRSRTLGQRGEDAAARYLKRLRYKIVARGSRDALGEIDLIAVDGRTVVFVEVKTRSSTTAGAPAEAVDADKQRRLTRLALAWMRRNGLMDYPCRFDIVGVHWPADAKQPHIEHLKNAFDAVGRGQMFN